MGLSRRRFTKEFKLAAVRRLETGISLAEVARGLEVNPTVLQRSRREFRQAPGNVFPGNGPRRRSEGRVAELERKIGRQVVEIDFLKGWLRAHRNSGCRRHRVEVRGLPEDRRRSDRRPWTDDRADGGAGASEPGQLLPLQRGSQAESRYGPITPTCAMPSSISRRSGPVMDDRASLRNCGGVDGRGPQ